MYNQAKQTKQTHNLLQMSNHTPPLPVKFIHRPMYAAHRCQHYKSSHNLCSPQFFFDTEKKETINLQKGLDLLDNLYANLFHFVDIWLLLKMHIFDL